MFAFLAATATRAERGRRGGYEGLLGLARGTVEIVHTVLAATLLLLVFRFSLQTREYRF